MPDSVPEYAITHFEKVQELEEQLDAEKVRFKNAIQSGPRAGRQPGSESILSPVFLIPPPVAEQATYLAYQAIRTTVVSGIITGRMAWHAHRFHQTAERTLNQEQIDFAVSATKDIQDLLADQE